MDREKVIGGLAACTGETNDCAGHTCPYWDFDGDISCRTQMELDAMALLQQQPETCKNCSYHRHDGWCDELHRETGDNDYCSFGAWKGDDDA